MMAASSRELRTERLRLRQWTPADREPFARFNADGRVMKYFTAALSSAESDAFADAIEDHIAQNGWGLWAVDVPGVTSFAGFIGLSRPRFEAHFTPCVEIGWRLGPDFWGRGYATEGARAVLRFGFDTLGLREIVSFTTETNLPSRRVMERIGMTHDPADDFDHPNLSPQHVLRRHVLYRKSP
jgi:RimJ/RimL family protein N-acetyltransferase